MAAPELLLSRAELEHFVQEGYCVRRALLPAERCAEVRDALWAHGHHHLRRDDPCASPPPPALSLPPACGPRPPALSVWGF